MIPYLSAGGWPAHRHLLALAFPMILANITTPLVGLVDTAVLGRMQHPGILAGASISTLIITQVIWLCGFLRMSTTGRSAQSFGDTNQQGRRKVFWQSLLLSQLLALFVLCLQTPLFDVGIALAAIESETADAAKSYFFTRVWSFPAAFANLVLVGWMVGQQLARQVMVIQILGNCANALLNLVFVYGLKAGVEGVAAATVIAEVLMLSMSLKVCFSRIGVVAPNRTWLQWQELRGLFTLNGNMFIRNLILQLCLAFVTLQGARYGVIAAGVNALVMQFFALIALGLDGVAYAVEALVGKAKGEKRRDHLLAHIAQGLFWSSAIALFYAALFALFHSEIASVLTDHSILIEAVVEYYWVIVLLPLLGHWCFLLDGVAVGLSRAEAMRNTMFLSALIGFFPVWWSLQNQQNTALWLAMLAFLTLRGVSLGLVFYRDYVLKDGFD